MNPSELLRVYVYGGDGTLFRRWVGASDNTIYVAGLYAKSTVGGTPTITKYYYANGQRIAMRTGATLYYMTGDHLGSTTLVTDVNRNLVTRTRYFPYGAIRTETGASPTDRRFTGQRRETSTIYNYNARFYHTDIGRMPQADTVVPDCTRPAAFNPYSYVEDNPANYTDPTGHSIYCRNRPKPPD